MSSRQRVALVTGAARGIGRSIALELAEQGRFVVCADLLEDATKKTVTLVEEAGGQGQAVRVDVTDTDGVKEMVADLEETHGAIDILVNNAGWDDLMLFVDTDEAFWDRIIDINYKGCLRTTHAVLPGMIERGWGRIVNLGSDAGRVGSSMEAVYAGSKAAIIAFTKSIARETARSGVTANCVCPGPTDTPLVRNVAASNEQGDKIIEAMTRAVPMRRLGQPEDVAPAIAFFTADGADFVTGQTLSVSGGLTMA